MVSYSLLPTKIFRLSVSRFVQKIFATKCRSRRKTEQMEKFFGPQFLWEGRLRLLYGRLLGQLSWTDYPLVGKVWLSSVCWSPSAKLGNEAECRIFGGWENANRVWSRLWTKVHDILRRCRPNMVQFRSATSEISWRKKERRRRNTGKIEVPRHTMSGGLIKARILTGDKLSTYLNERFEQRH